MMGKSPLAKALVGKQVNLPPALKAKIKASPEPGSSPAKIIPLLAGKAAALIGKKLLAKGVAKAGAKAAAKAGTKAATKKASGKLMEKAGKKLIDNKDNIRSKMKSRMQGKGEEEKKAPAANISSSNPYASQNTVLQMKGKKPSPVKQEVDPKSVSGSYELSKRLSESRKNSTTEGKEGDMSSFANMFRSTSSAYNGATQTAKEEAKKTSSDKVSDTPPMKPIERALQERGAAMIKRGQVKGNQRAYDRAKRQGYDAEAVTGLTEGRGPKSGSGGKTSRSINRQITKSDKSADRVVKQGKRQEERTERVALRNAPKSPKAAKAAKVEKTAKVEQAAKVDEPLNKRQQKRADKKVEGYVKPLRKGQKRRQVKKTRKESIKATEQFEKATKQPSKTKLKVPSSVAKVPVAKRPALYDDGYKDESTKSKSNPVENAYTPTTKKQKNKTAKGESRIESKRIRKTKNKETGKRIKRGETDDSFSGAKMVDGKVQLNTKRQALKDEKEKRKNIGKPPTKMKTKTPNKMMKKAPSKMMKKAPAKMMKKAPAKMMKKKK